MKTESPALMAGWLTRLRWRIGLSSRDGYLVLGLLAVLSGGLWLLLLLPDPNPDPRDLRGGHGELEEALRAALKHAGADEGLLLDPELHERELEREKFRRVQEKLKLMGPVKPPKHRFDPLPETEKPVVEVEKVDEEKVVKDKAYWMQKYRHVFHGGFELDIQAAGDELRGGKARCTVYDHTKPVNASYECVNLKVKHHPVICLYPPDQDIHISKHIRETGIWEPHIVKLITGYLNADPNLGFIDIGANIGAYSLVAAALGHRVVAVEPYEENLRHLSLGLQKSRLQQNIIVLRNAVSDRRLRFVNLRLDASNQGGVAVDDSNDDYGCYGDDDCPPQASTILMNDILEVTNFKSAVMKIDIEGYEHRALQESSELFDHLYVPYIVMEWIQLKAHYGTDMDQSPDKALVQELVEYLVERGYAAFSMVTGEELPVQAWYAWPDDVVWKHLLARET